MEDTLHTQEFTNVYESVKAIVAEKGFTVVEENLTKPWGAYVRLDNGDAEQFAATYFPNRAFDTFENLSPKFLIVAPGKRLSWQKHARRAEIWSVLRGPVGAKTSDTDDEPEEVTVLQTGESIEFDTEVRHRLIGLDDWGIVTEIWDHTKAPELSDENDIVRIQDDFSR